MAWLSVKRDVQAVVLENVKPNATLYTDEWNGYTGRDRMYFHHTINHGSKVYTSGPIHTQAIEGFWVTVKNGLRGVYDGVPRKNLRSYADECVFRYNTRTTRRTRS
jgi:transposase-like protein